jgi:hypothetical protein
MSPAQIHARMGSPPDYNGVAILASMRDLDHSIASLAWTPAGRSPILGRCRAQPLKDQK